MFKVYIDYDKMREICLNQDESDGWYKILCKQNNININHSVNDADFYDENNPLLIFSQMTNAEFSDATDYMEEISRDNSKVLNEPCGAFLLNIEQTKADEIQKKFGVICQATDEMNSEILTSGDITVTTLTPGSWESRMSLGKEIPSNSLILVDRYLFSSETNDSLQDSLDNISDIMKAFLPERYNSEYHLCIIFDIDTINNKDMNKLIGTERLREFTEEDRKKAFSKISSLINRIKNDFVKAHGYNIRLEVITCDKRDKESYEKTHDRYIYSNYFYVTASHKLKAYREGQPIIKQRLDLLTLYAKGLKDVSDIPVYAHTDGLKDLHSIINESKKHPILHLYSVNGNCNVTIDNALNRVII